jgi:chloride channel 7
VACCRHLRKTTKREEKILDATRWAVFFAIGVAVALFAVAINTVTTTLAREKYQYIRSSMHRCAADGCLAETFALWLCINGGLALVSTLVVVVLAPAATGSGIPEVKSYLNGIKIPEVVRYRPCSFCVLS